MAAALVRSPDGDENWILAEVVGYNSTSGKYEVDDIDEEQKDRHTLSRRKVIPLPTMRACPETSDEALYAAGESDFRESICWKIICLVVLFSHRFCVDGIFFANFNHVADFTTFFPNSLIKCNILL